MQRKVKRIHFVGIGGIGMSGIAEVLLNLGYGISGSDAQVNETTERLRSLGAQVAHGHAAENIGSADVVVTSTAVKADNPEVQAAQRRAIPVIPRAEMLAELLKMKFSVAVSGSHGKTTTTSMISTLLARGGLDPTMVIGGKLASIGSNARLGDGDIIVAEADESDGSFLKLSPAIAVVTNIDREHLDYYPGIAEIKDAFLKFANIVPFYGCTVMCNDNEHVRAIIGSVKRRVITYGIDAPADYRARDIRCKPVIVDNNHPGVQNANDKKCKHCAHKHSDKHHWDVPDEPLTSFPISPSRDRSGASLFCFPGCRCLSPVGMQHTSPKDKKNHNGSC